MELLVLGRDDNQVDQVSLQPSVSWRRIPGGQRQSFQANWTFALLGADRVEQGERRTFGAGHDRFRRRAIDGVGNNARTALRSVRHRHSHVATWGEEEEQDGRGVIWESALGCNSKIRNQRLFKVKG